MLVKVRVFVALLILCVASACTSTRPAGPTPAPTATPAMPRWKLWERALGDILNGPAGNTHPDLGQDHGICEWEIWGQNGNDVYVWALCEVYHTGTGATATSAPAIVRLAQDDSPSAVIMPAEGWGNLRDLFPADIVTRILKHAFDVQAAEQDIALRSGDPSLPPLIIQNGGVLP
jgi:hypothetical protein